MESYDVKKLYRNLYTTSSKVIALVDVPELTYIMLDGVGNPSVDEFKLKSKALQMVSRELRNYFKDEILYTVPPLEGIWDTYDNSHFDVTRKKMIKFTLMMVQVPSLTEQILNQIKLDLSLRTDNPYILDVYLKKRKGERAVQLLHKGAYHTEINSTKKIMEYITVENYKLAGMHHEIYLNKPEKTAEEDLKTIIRYAIERG